MRKILAEIATNVKNIRMRKNLTQDKLAELADLSTAYIYQIESGKKNMSIVTLIKLMHIFNVGANEIIIYGGERTTYDSCAEEIHGIIKNATTKEQKIMLEMLQCLQGTLKRNINNL